MADTAHVRQRMQMSFNQRSKEIKIVTVHLPQLALEAFIALGTLVFYVGRVKLTVVRVRF